MSLPTVAVVGATGHQGGSVVKALSASGKFQVRALTRDPTKASDLTKLPNVTLAAFDLNKPELVNEALKGGVYAVFGVTNFYDPAVLANHQLEIDQGKRLIDAAVANGVKYFIWSTLPPASKISNGKYHVTHFDNKFEVAEYARTKPSLKLINVHATYYLQNLGMQVQSSDNGYTMALPMKDSRLLDYFDVNDLGKVVAAILNSPEKFVGRDIVASAGQATGKQFVEAIARVSGKPATYIEISAEQYASYLPAEIGPDLTAMFQFYSDFGFSNDMYDNRVARDELGVKFTTLDEYLAKSQFAVKK